MLEKLKQLREILTFPKDILRLAGYIRETNPRFFLKNSLTKKIEVSPETPITSGALAQESMTLGELADQVVKLIIEEDKHPVSNTAALRGTTYHAVEAIPIVVNPDLQTRSLDLLLAPTGRLTSRPNIVVVLTESEVRVIKMGAPQPDRKLDKIAVTLTLPEEIPGSIKHVFIFTPDVAQYGMIDNIIPIDALKLGEYIREYRITAVYSIEVKPPVSEETIPRRMIEELRKTGQYSEGQIRIWSTLERHPALLDLVQRILPHRNKHS